jgi:hypothetical protein
VTNNELKRLRKLAEAATPGPWDASIDLERPDDVRVCYVRDGKHCDWCVSLSGECVEGTREWTPETLQRWRADAAFIAAANPTAVIALLDAVEGYQRGVDALRDQLAAANAECERLTALTINPGATLHGSTITEIATDRDNLRSQLAAMTAARDEACDLADRLWRETGDKNRLAATNKLRAVGGDK